MQALDSGAAEKMTEHLVLWLVVKLLSSELLGFVSQLVVHSIYIGSRPSGLVGFLRLAELLVLPDKHHQYFSETDRYLFVFGL